MLVRLVRHACAGDKRAWDGDDADRPLDDLGRAEAAAIADALGALPPARLRSSPTARCRQTLQPLAGRWSVPVEDEPLLAADAPVDLVLDLLRSADDGDVLCTHGEVLRPLLPRLGVKADEAALTKGSWWELEITGPRVTAKRQVLPLVG